MRLINADELTVDYIVTSTTTNTLCHRYISKEQVENAPTVDAVPIEWIKDYILRTWLTDYNSSELKVIERMLNDWMEEEAENEGCRSR